MESKIKPELIATGERQKIVADLQPFSKAKEQVGLTVAELNKFLTISTKEQLADAMAVLSVASKVEKAIEKKRKEVVAPFNDGATAINDHAKQITSGLPAAITAVKNAAMKFQREEEERALELKMDARRKQIESMGFIWDDDKEEFINGDVDFKLSYPAVSDEVWVRLISNAQEALQQQEAAKLEALKDDDDFLEMLGIDKDDVTAEAFAPAKAVETLPAPSTKYFERPKLAGAAKVWKFEIEDESLVPREFLIVNETAIRSAVREGKREIAGVRIFQEDQLRIR